MNITNPYSKDTRSDRAAHNGYEAAKQGITLTPPEYADSDELRFSWMIGNRRAKYDINNS